MLIYPTWFFLIIIKLASLNWIGLSSKITDPNVDIFTAAFKMSVPQHDLNEEWRGFNLAPSLIKRYYCSCQVRPAGVWPVFWCAEWEKWWFTLRRRTAMIEGSRSSLRIKLERFEQIKRKTFQLRCLSRASVSASPCPLLKVNSSWHF